MIVNANSIVQHVIQIKNGMTLSLTHYPTCISEESSYFKCIVDNSVIVCNEIINVTDRVSTNMENTMATKSRVLIQ